MTFRLTPEGRTTSGKQGRKCSKQSMLNMGRRYSGEKIQEPCGNWHLATHKVKGCQCWCDVCVEWWVRDGAGEKWERQWKSLKQFSVALCCCLKTEPIQQPMWYLTNSGDFKKSLKIMLCSLKYFSEFSQRLWCKNMILSSCNIVDQSHGGPGQHRSIFPPNQPFSSLKNNAEFTWRQGPYWEHCLGLNIAM